jgi:hypothetical protein
LSRGQGSWGLGWRLAGQFASGAAHPVGLTWPSAGGEEVEAGGADQAADPLGAASASAIFSSVVVSTGLEQEIETTETTLTLSQSTEEKGRNR